MKTIENSSFKKSLFQNTSFKKLCLKKLSKQNLDKIVDENFEIKRFDGKNIKNLSKIFDSNKFFNKFDKNFHKVLSENLKVCLLACPDFKILIEIHPYDIEQIDLLNINDKYTNVKTKTHYLGFNHFNFVFKIIDSLTKIYVTFFYINSSVLCPLETLTYLCMIDKYCKNTFPGCQNIYLLLSLLLLLLLLLLFFFIFFH